MRRVFGVLAAASLVVVLALVSTEAAEPSQRAKDNIAKIEPILPEFEKAADECEKALQPFMDSKDPNVVSAVDAALLRISAVRSVRTMIATQPDFFAWHIGKGQLEQWKEGMSYYLDCAKSGKDPFEGMTSGIRPLRSKIDGQILFYVFKLPKDYDPKKKYPVDIGLHAGAGLIWRGDWMDGKPGNNPAQASAEERIYISPCGRGNNCYGGMGEIAIIEAIDHLKKHYSVDENRIHIGGASMGGTGGFRLCAFYPDVFAVGDSLTGGANYGVPVGNGRFDGYLLGDNFANTGFCIWDTPGDGHYKANNAFAEGLRERARKYPGYYANIELTDPKGGHGNIDRKLQDEGREWLRKQVRNPFPKLVIYKTYNLRYDGAYWAYVDVMEKPDEPARIEAEVQPGNRLRVAVENVERFHLNLVKELVGDAKELAASVNGAPAFSVPAGKTVYFAKTDGKWNVSDERYPKGLVKKHGVSGPLMDVFMEEPVLMVYGTRETGDKKKSEGMVDEAVLRMFGPSDGGGTLHTMFERKGDTAVTKEDIAEKNLVLFGTPKQNAFLAKITDKLPVKFLDDGVEIAGKAYRGEGVGLTMVYPNPLNPERYVLILPEKCGHFDPRTMPDYAVGKVVPGYGGQVLRGDVQGNFDSHWQITGKE